MVIDALVLEQTNGRQRFDRGGKMASRGRVLRPLLDAAIAGGRLGGEHYAGRWQDIGTPERLQALDDLLRASGAR